MTNEPLTVTSHSALDRVREAWSNRVVQPEIYTDEGRSEVRTRLHMLRQQIGRPPGVPNLSLSDFVAPVGTPDWIGAFAVTAGGGVKELVERYEADHDDYHAILVN